MELHQELTGRYRWYADWHANPRHERYHWAALALFALFVFGTLSFQVRQNEAELQAYVRGSLENVFRTTVIGRGNTIGFAEDRILVKFKSVTSAGERATLLSRHGLASQDKLRGLDIQLLRTSPSDTPEEVAARLNAAESRLVEFAEPDAILAPSAVPNDPWFPNWQYDKQLIDAPAAWDVTQGDPALIVGVADTGVFCGHEDLLLNCVPGWNFYDNGADTSDVVGHGTAVAGVIAARGNNGIGVAGAVWPSKIMPLRVSDPNGYATLSAIANAITYAADRGARVVNVSYQASGSNTVRSAAQYLAQKGGLTVVSAGNTGGSTGFSANADLLVVSATDSSDTRYAWSSYGDDVDVAAPGCTGATTARDGAYANFCGTSNSAPEVSGVVALVFSAHPELTPAEAQNTLFSSTKDLGVAGWDPYYGWGRVDAGKAVTATISSSTSPVPPPPPPAPGIVITSYSVTKKTATTATIQWTTNIVSTGTISFGTASTNLDRSATDGVSALTHAVTLTGLVPNTKYFFRVNVSGPEGTSGAVSPISTFRTRAK